jgi:hypothetical protein
VSDGERGPNWAKGLTAATDERIARRARSMTGRPNWARGLTAATDDRIAKNAASRRGKSRGPRRSISRRTAPDSKIITRASDALRVDQYPDYMYLFGLYLGDGCLVRYPSTYRLEIYLDPKYPGIIQSCARAMRAIHVNGRANIRVKGELVRSVVASAVPAAWARPQASAPDRTCRVAAGPCPRISMAPVTGLPRFGRLSVTKNRTWQELSVLRIQERVARHSQNL